MNTNIEEAFQLQHDFLKNLSTYVNSGCMSRQDIFISLALPTIPFHRNAHSIIKQYKALEDSTFENSNPALDVGGDVYKGKNTYVLRMMDHLSAHLQDDLLGAYVLGSLGTYEEVAYSDFDALVIIKDEVFENPRRLAKVAHTLYQAQSIMWDFDPLQHHGWFVLTETDLRAYPNHYFPVELFQHAKALFTDKGLNLKIHLNYSPEMNRKVFDELSNNLVKRIKAKKYPRNMYQLKGLLSQFMLLPAYYVEARDNKGIYKKFSFDAAKIDFAKENWTIMDEISQIRDNWFYKISPFKKWAIIRSSPLSRYFAKRCAPSISTSMKKILTEKFYRRMVNLVVLMQEKLH